MSKSAKEPERPSEKLSESDLRLLMNAEVQMSQARAILAFVNQHIVATYGMAQDDRVAEHGEIVRGQQAVRLEEGDKAAA